MVDHKSFPLIVEPPHALPGFRWVSRAQFLVNLPLLESIDDVQWVCRVSNCFL